MHPRDAAQLFSGARDLRALGGGVEGQRHVPGDQPGHGFRANQAQAEHLDALDAAEQLHGFVCGGDGEEARALRLQRPGDLHGAHAVGVGLQNGDYPAAGHERRRGAVVAPQRVQIHLQPAAGGGFLKVHECSSPMMRLD